MDGTGKNSYCNKLEKAYWLALAIIATILQQNSGTIFNIDGKIWDKLGEWIISSKRKQLDSVNYVYINYLARLIEISNETWIQEKEECNIQDVDVAKILSNMEQELIDSYDKIGNIEIIRENTAINNYNIRWVKMILEGQYGEIIVKEIPRTILTTLQYRSDIKLFETITDGRYIDRQVFGVGSKLCLRCNVDDED
ncbi:hypothetical protein RclHR1_14630003 [Rhizophagus clarus]|uniref:Uncharacterized protein n=1 Tax=Rhizophagus clarus TaxID=94130 RepID=A0A2Z6QEZ5_9GLOM|nr:hypothetical protein RclHR1_14630003 [Rhizophagus clarus]GES97427.1 hypothetical protein RCL_jg8606.t1 [Rhizophagus clarus]